MVDNNHGAEHMPDITADEFDTILAEILNECGKPATLLAIPGVYECVCEEFNNEVLKRWEQAKQENADA